MLEGRLLLPLLALSLGLASAQKALDEVPVQPGFDSQKVEGRWFTVQLAASHAHLVSPEDPLKLSLYSIWTRDSGDVEFVLFWKGEGACEGINITVHPTGLLGQYLGSSGSPQSRGAACMSASSAPTMPTSSFTYDLRTTWSPAYGCCWRGACPGTPRGWGGSRSAQSASTCTELLSPTRPARAPHPGWGEVAPPCGPLSLLPFTWSESPSSRSPVHLIPALILWATGSCQPRASRGPAVPPAALGWKNPGVVGRGAWLCALWKHPALGPWGRPQCPPAQGDPRGTWVRLQAQVELLEVPWVPGPAPQ